MILEQQKENLELNDGEASESIGMSLDMDSAFVLMQMLSKNLYSDPIGSTIRECASNALDSHRRIGSTDPIIVSLQPNPQGVYEFTVEDFGSGLDADDVQNIISKYGKSTKRNSATELGMMGLGFKSPLAYTSSFYFVCRKNGVERKYMMYEGEEGNKIDLLLEIPTTEKNGVKIIVPVRPFDRANFYSKIKEQLAYFEGVYFNVSGISNDFTIIRHDLFQISPLSSDTNLHLCLDNVYYPLDFQKLGISRITFPAALKFSLTDGIFPVPNREQLKYTTETIKTIKDRIKQLADYCIDKYNETSGKECNLEEYCYFYYNKDTRNLKIGEKIFNINPLTNYSQKQFVDPTLKGIKLLKITEIVPHIDFFLREYNVEYKKDYKSISETNRNEFLHYHHLKSNVFVFTQPFKNKMKAFIKDTYPGHAVFVKKNNKIPLFKPVGTSYDKSQIYWVNLLKLKNYPKDTWRERIKEGYKIIEYLTEGFINLDEVKITSEWEAARKVERISNKKERPSKERKQMGEVVGKLAVKLERHVHGKSCKFESTNFKLDTAYKEKHTTVYTSVDNEDKVQKYFTVLFTNKVKFVLFSNRELKYLKDFKSHNWLTMEEFEKGEHAEFRRMVTGYLISELIESQREVFSRTEIIGKVSTALFNDMKTLADYKAAHYRYADDSIYNSMLSVASKGKLFDYSVYPTYLKVKQTLERLAFLNSILKRVVNRYDGPTSDVDEYFIQALRDLFKYHKQKIDIAYYKPQIVEPATELTEETIEEWVA